MHSTPSIRTPSSDSRATLRTFISSTVFPAMGRGIAELITYGAFRTLDLSALGFDRIAAGRPVVERAII